MQSISHLSEKEQELLRENMEVNECSPSLSQAKRLKKYSQEGKLTEDVIDAIMTEEKETDTKLVLKGDTIKKYFPKEYTPMQIKKAVTGTGGADKKQVIFMVQRLLGLRGKIEPDDVSDALAAAVCGLHQMRILQLQAGNGRRIMDILEAQRNPLSKR